MTTLFHAIAVRLPRPEEEPLEVMLRRPTHGEFDVGKLERLAQLAPRDENAGIALAGYVEAALQACVLDPPNGFDAYLEQIDRADWCLAADAGDAIADALGLTAMRRAEIEMLLGTWNGPCRGHVVEAGREKRFKLEGEPASCGAQCPEGFCMFERGASLEAEMILRDWLACGGRDRRCLPRGGGLEDQDAAVAYWFQAIDGMAARATAAPVKGGR